MSSSFIGGAFKLKAGAPAQTTTILPKLSKSKAIDDKKEKKRLKKEKKRLKKEKKRQKKMKKYQERGSDQETDRNQMQDEKKQDEPEQTTTHQQQQPMIEQIEMTAAERRFKEI